MEEPKFCIDLKRPEIFDDEDRAFWGSIHAQVEEMGDRIIKNGIYRYIQTVLDDNLLYSGGGFSYKFWFNDERDLDEFITRLSTLISPRVMSRLEVRR